jgi:hypothetical protein
VSYSSLTLTSEADNGTYVCYKAVDAFNTTTYALSNVITGIDTTAPVTTDNANNTWRNTDFTVTLTPNES